MANVKKGRFVKVGAVLKKEGKVGSFIVLGDSQNKNEKYRTTVEVTVKDSSGKVLAKTENGFLTVLNPRLRPNITEEQAAKIPARLVSELFIVENND